MQKITPFLWFDRNAEEAVSYYLSIFKNAKILAVAKYSKGGPLPEGSVMTIKFQLEGQELVALNGGPTFKFTEAISLVVNCDTQAEIDTLWEKLSAGGEKSRCGWLKDKFGLSWQIVPAVLGDLISTEDARAAQRVFGAMLQMDKLDLQRLQEAYAKS